MIAAIVILVTLGLLSATASRLFITQTSNSSDFFQSRAVLLLAESGLEKAKYELSINPAYSGETATTFANGTFSTSVLTTDFTGAALPSGQLRINSIGSLATSGSAVINRTVEAIITLGGGTITTWAAGKNGRLYQWDGSQWDRISAPFTFDINAIHCSSANDCWFVGDNGNIGHWNGTAFSTSRPGWNDLKDISCNPNNATQCFAVGEDGEIMARNGASWSLSPTPTGRDLNAIHCPDSNCYAVGDKGTILEWVAGSWVDASMSGIDDLNGIACLSSTNCWAVGDERSDRFTTLNRIGSGWSNESFRLGDKKDLKDIACIPITGSCMAVGKDGTLLSYDGSLPWTRASSGTGKDIDTITCSSVATECWAVAGSNKNRSTVLHWTGTSWSSSRAQISTVFITPGSGSSSLTTSAWREIIP